MATTKTKTRARAAADLEREIRRARARGDAERAAGLLATSARYDRATRRVVLEMTNGVAIALPLRLFPEIASASDDELARVELLGAGGGIAWDALGADYGVQALVASFVGPEVMSRELGRLGGLSTSRTKAAAARANGAKGGRPRKSAAAKGPR